jgi:hypothetical protein
MLPVGGRGHQVEGRMKGRDVSPVPRMRALGSNPAPLRMDRGEAKGELVDSFRLATASPRAGRWLRSAAGPLPQPGGTL